MLTRHPGIAPMHPGELLREVVLPDVPMTKTAIARALQISRQTLYDIINERQPVTAEMAVRFGKFFSQNASFWINLQRNYDLAIARQNVDVSGIKPFDFAEVG